MKTTYTLAGPLELSSGFSQCFDLVEGTPTFRLLIDGKWVTSSGGKTEPVDTPIDDSVFARVQDAVASDVDSAVSAAYSSRRKIREIPAIDRIAILNRAGHLMEERHEDFVKTLMLEAGKTVSAAEAEVKTSVNRIKMTMEEARRIFGEYVPGDWCEDTLAKFALVIHEPVGVIACIAPFNYPLFSMVAKAVPALVSGNSVVMKPASDTPISSILFGRVLEEAGIPAGVVNLVTGKGSVVGSALVSNPHVSMVTFTGSTETGRRVAQLAGMKRLHLELGGKGAAIIAPDADLKFAARKVLEGSFKYSGQRCDAISRVFVPQAVYAAFLNHVLEEYDAWKAGDPREPDTKVGPLINPEAATRVQGLVDDAVARGAKLLKGGHHAGSYFEPTILSLVPPDAIIASEETFGPVVTIIQVADVDEAIDLTNQSKYGLDSCVFTRDFYTAWKVAKALDEGTVCVNDAPAHGVGYFPFGGNKDSGIGREGVGYSIDEMTRIKTIQFNLAPGGLGKVRRPVSRTS
jgi:glyceraldehyde-3-phosphate dehydrogenase [NAD(P)+]